MVVTLVQHVNSRETEFVSGAGLFCKLSTASFINGHGYLWVGTGNITKGCFKIASNAQWLCCEPP